MPHMHAWIASSIFYEERHYDLWDDYEKGRITGEYLSTQRERERLWEIQREHGKKLLADGIAEMDRYNRAAREDTARWQASRSKQYFYDALSKLSGPAQKVENNTRVYNYRGETIVCNTFGLFTNCN